MLRATARQAVVKRLRHMKDQLGGSIYRWTPNITEQVYQPDAPQGQRWKRVRVIPKEDLPENTVSAWTGLRSDMTTLIGYALEMQQFCDQAIRALEEK